MLDCTDMVIAELIAELYELHAFAIIPGCIDLLRIVRWEKVEAEFHGVRCRLLSCPSLFFAA
jgi:hypothetical protein